MSFWQCIIMFPDPRTYPKPGQFIQCTHSRVRCDLQSEQQASGYALLGFPEPRTHSKPEQVNSDQLNQLSRRNSKNQLHTFHCCSNRWTARLPHALRHSTRCRPRQERSRCLRRQMRQTLSRSMRACNHAESSLAPSRTSMRSQRQLQSMLLIDNSFIGKNAFRQP